MKLGYVFKGDQAKLKLRSYMGPALPPPPAAVDWTLAISEDLGMMGNDQVGDCTCADVGHTVMLLTAMGSGIVVPTQHDVLTLYSGATGYLPGDESTDQGASLTEIAKYVQENGLLVNGIPHKIHAYLDVTAGDRQQAMQSIYLFKHLAIGVQLPRSAMDGFGKGIWSDTTDTDILGGHDIPLVAYDAEGPTAITWGAYQKMTWAWYAKYCDEAQARIYEDLAGQGWNEGFDMQALEADLAALG